jgi:tetratricopeptide (TPR) repeat protein
MGFSVQQAKKALASTSRGLDVDAALEILLRDGTPTPPRSEQISPAPEFNPRRPSDPSSSRLDISPAQQTLQDQADKLMAQASSIGLSMFSKANALWKEGREKVAKVYEEQGFSSNTANDVSKGNGRPKWMDEAKMTAESESLTSQKPVYKSPARRRPPVKPAYVEHGLPPAMPAEPPVKSPAHPPPLSRPIIEVSPAALSSSNSHKVAGTEHYKLGRFAEAESSYSHAIHSLPASHLLRVPLHNNRALVRLKIGEYKGSIEDTTEALNIVTGNLGTAWHPGREAEQPGVNLGEAVSKALRRRAEANEGLEKWMEAAIDWERLNATPWANQAYKMDAVKSLSRCRAMVAHQNSTADRPSDLKPEVRSKPKPKPAPVSSQARPAEALSRVRAANIAQEKEEQDRHDLKDVVDAHLEAWRTGKETNIRALIASLDTVLPSTFAWQKVSMAELVTPKQVKIRYTKAIARLHPDKVSDHPCPS